MTSTRAKDFLTKELFIKKNVVTFRSLSRELGIHVNDAKNELAAYLADTANTDTPSFATYMVSGQISPLHTNGSLLDAMDVTRDDDNAHQSVVRSKIVLVDCDGLQDAKAQFTRIHSVYIYSLSPSVLRDAGLICQPTASVRNADTKGNPGLNGKIISAHVKIRNGLPKNVSAASSSKTTLDARKPVMPQPHILPQKLEQTTDKGKRNEVSKDNVHAKPLATTKEQPKPTGKLDWSKGKSKEQEITSGPRVKDKAKLQPRQDTKISLSSAKSADKPSGNSDMGLQSMKKPISKVPAVEPKRTTKRKSPDPSDSDVDVEHKSTPKDGRVMPSAMNHARVKRGVVVSDDEDEEVPSKLHKNITRSTSDSERSLAAMMDIDDDQVVRASRLSSHRPDVEVDDTGDEVDQTDVDALISSLGEEEEEDVKPQAKKRKSKKVIPVGGNGLKKRRILKSRTTTDAKGYMQTEDYSSYESVSEEEAVPEEPKKRKSRKVVPVGRNGLKKRHVIKNRTTTDAKGYTHTEEYSSYESVSEDEAVEVAPDDAKRTKSKKKAESKSKNEAGDKPVQANSKIKETNSLRGTKTKGGKAPKRGGLLNFFGPDKSKK
ncbi:DNA polymerase subunit Cdc27-domain-containing protein [Suillus fuscotomentosus]|uniref:DNA polymerase delta subunit 3 n=1 Tax=Suillus fuscotomentosus TaxID=1912939 RepID=A0AAD4EFF1_9AGAM|nr:DNA polymerase subunit Cdc27-domain-containing protein [Suillus fuscotomentosus]KAG1905137.1 DNA polymerase subunit Cdc27-domain-containing protein [Suillus fuscotomentosus]